MLKGGFFAIEEVKDLCVSEGKNGASQGCQQRDMLSFISEIIQKLYHLHDFLAPAETLSPVNFEGKACLPKYVFKGLQMGECKKENTDTYLVFRYLLPSSLYGGFHL